MHVLIIFLTVRNRRVIMSGKIEMVMVKLQPKTNMNWE